MITNIQNIFKLKNMLFIINHLKQTLHYFTLSFLKYIQGEKVLICIWHILKESAQFVEINNIKY